MVAGTSKLPGADERRHIFVVLDGMRGIAALAVVTWHGEDLFGAYALRSSYLAVDLFFVLSGFVIAHAYEAKLLAGQSVTEFMIIRLVRLYPLYLLGTAVGILLAVLQMMFGDELIWTPTGLLVASAFALLFLPAPGRFSGGDDTFPLNGPAWSLFFELAINLVYAVVVRHLTDSRLIAIVIASVVPLVATGVAYGSLDVGWQWQHIWGGAGRVCFSFFAGVLAYRIWTRKRPQYAVPAWLLVPSIVLIFAMRPPDELRVAFDLVAALVVFPLLVYAYAAARESGLAARVYVMLGLLSYGVYALHWGAAQLIQRFWRKAMPVELADFAPYGGLLFEVLIVCIVLIVDRYYDQPVRRALLALVHGRSKDAAARLPHPSDRPGRTPVARAPQAKREALRDEELGQ